MRLIGITGSIACGKSTVSRELIRRGFPVIDGDALSRELTGPDGQAMNRIRAVFGEQYILPDGSLNRAEMGRLVFSDDAARELLDQVMAPYLQALTLNRIEAARSSGSSLCFLDMPLLYEKGYDRYCDTVWCVWIPEELQISRLMNIWSQYAAYFQAYDHRLLFQATGEIVKEGNTSRKMVFEARKVITARPDINDSAAEVLDEPILVCRASGTCVTPKDKQRCN